MSIRLKAAGTKWLARQGLCFAEGVLFGLTVAAAIGPIALLIINTSVQFGLSAGLRSALGAAIADLCYALGAAFAGVGLVHLIEDQSHNIELMASVLLVGVGLVMAVSALRTKEGEAKSVQVRRPFATTFALTIVNPLTLVVFAAFVAQSSRPSGADDSIAIALAVFAGSLVVQIALALGGTGLGGLIANRAIMRTLNIMSGLGVAAFGVAGLFRG